MCDEAAAPKFNPVKPENPIFLLKEMTDFTISLMGSQWPLSGATINYFIEWLSILDCATWKEVQNLLRLQHQVAQQAGALDLQHDRLAGLELAKVSL